MIQRRCGDGDSPQKSVVILLIIFRISTFGQNEAEFHQVDGLPPNFREFASKTTRKILIWTVFCGEMMKIGGNKVPYVCCIFNNINISWWIELTSWRDTLRIFPRLTYLEQILISDCKFWLSGSKMDWTKRNVFYENKFKFKLGFETLIAL